MMSQNRRYKNPPIEEAVVEFHFEPGQDWDLTIPGKLHQHRAIKDEYPGKPRQQKVVEAALQTGPTQPASFAVREGLGRIQLVGEDGKRLVSLGPDVLSINVLRPYENWEKFQPRIENALRAYQDIANPAAVKRVGVRYINKIVFPRHKKLDDYFRCGPEEDLDGLPNTMADFTSCVEYVYDDDVKLLLTQASVDEQAESSAFLLDIDMIWKGRSAVGIDDAMKIVDDLHVREVKAFEATITEETRKLFDAD